MADEFFSRYTSLPSRILANCFDTHINSGINNKKSNRLDST